MGDALTKSGLTFYKLGCTSAKQNQKSPFFILLCVRFALTFHKLGCTSAKQNQKNLFFYFALRSVCTNFASNLE